MLTEVICPCDAVQQINVPEGWVNDLGWECSKCERRLVWPGPEGAVPVTLPDVPSHVVSITDVDVASGSNQGG